MQDLSLLQKSFESFNKATIELEHAYARLEERFHSLNRELENKNAQLLRTIEEKEQTKNYLENILESLINGVIVTDLEGRISKLNSCAEMFTGLREEAVIGKHISFLFEAMPASDWKTINPAEYFKGESGHKVKIAMRTFDLFCSPFKSPAGSVIGHVFLLRDITRIEKLEEMAKRTEKFAAMGEMAANIAHEIRNPLGSIELFASLLLKNMDLQRDRDRALQIIASVKNVDNKISNLLLFTRKPSPKMKATRLHQILKNVIDFSAQIIEQAGIDVHVRLADEDILISADEELMKQVFFNIILNAQQAMPEGGDLSITTRLVPKSLLEPDEKIAEIIFQDSGPGIPPSDLTRIFDPFFSTRDNASGLGLAIVHNIVGEHNGSVSVENAKPGGMLVNICLPASKVIRQ